MGLSMIDIAQQDFLQELPDLLQYRPYFEYVWSDLKPTLGTQNQDLIDLYWLASLVRRRRFDCIVEVGRAGGTVTSVIAKFKDPETKFISICPQKTFLEETLPLLRSKYPLPEPGPTQIIEALLEEIPLLTRIGDAHSILLLFDAEHAQKFARYYLDEIVEPLGGRNVLVGVHDIFCPDIQPHTHPNQWDDPNGPFIRGELACRWDEIFPVVEYIDKHNVPAIQTGTFYRRVLQEHSEIDPYFREIATVKVPPYSELWPFDGAAGTWLFFDVAPTAPGAFALERARAKEIALTARRRLKNMPVRVLRDRALTLASSMRGRLRSLGGRIRASVYQARSLRATTRAVVSKINRAKVVDSEVAELERLRAQDSPDAAALQSWLNRKQEHLRSLTTGNHDHLHFEMMRVHLSECPERHTLLPLFSLALLTRAKRMVELGSGFTIYPKSYGSPWQISASEDEAMISTRILLSACRILNRFGVDSKLTSVEIREDPVYQGEHISDGARNLFDQMGLLQYWSFHPGTDSIEWLGHEKQFLDKGQAEPIDLAYVDSNHTYAQVLAELEGLTPLMSPTGVIFIDNAYAVFYAPNVDWAPNETREGMLSGGKYGAIHHFLETHPEWIAEWSSTPMDWVYLRKLAA